MLFLLKSVIIGIVALTEQLCDLESKTRNSQAQSEEESNYPGYKAQQEQRSLDLAGDVQVVQNRNDEDQEQDCEQDPQPQEGLGSGDREHCKAQGVCNGLRPLLKGYVLLGCFGVPLAVEQLSVYDLEERDHCVVDLNRVGSVCLSNNELVNDGLGCGSIGGVGSNYPACGNGGENLTDLHGNRVRSGFAVNAGIFRAVDLVGDLLGLKLYRYVHVASGHRECAVFNGNLGAVGILGYHDLCIVECRIVVGGIYGYRYGGSVSGLAVGGVNRYVVVKGYVVAQNGVVFCIDLVRAVYGIGCQLGEIVCFPNTHLAFLCGNGRLGNEGCIVLNGNVGKGLCANKLYGVLGCFPICVQIHVCNTKFAGKAAPLACLFITGGNVGNVLHSGCKVGQEVHGLVVGVCKERVDLRHGVVLGQIVLQLAVYIVINVEISQLNGYGNIQTVFGHDHALAVVALYLSLAGDLRNDAYDLITGNYKCKGDSLADRIVAILAGGILHVAVHGIGAVGDLQIQARLGCNCEIREVHCIKPYVILTAHGYHVAVHSLANTVFHGANANGLVERVGGCICIGNLNADGSLEALGELIAVHEELEGVEVNALCLCISGTCEGLGSAVSRFIAEEYGISCISVELCQGCILKGNEIVAVLCGGDLQRNLCRRVCTLEQVCIVEIQYKGLGHVTLYGDDVRAVVFGNVIIYLSVKTEEVIGNGGSHYRQVCIDLGACKYATCNAALGLFIPSNGILVKEQGIYGSRVRKIDLAGNCCQLICILAERVALFHHDHANRVVGLILEGNLHHVTVCIYREILCGHLGNHVTVRIGPCNKLISGNAGVVLEYVKVCANGQVCLEERGQAIAAHVGNLIQVLEANRKVCAKSDRAAVDAIKQSLYAGNCIDLFSNLIDHLFHQCLGIDGNLLVYVEYAVFVVCITDADRHQLIGELIGNCENVVLYLIIYAFLLCSLVNCDLVKLICGVGFKNCLYVHTDLGSDHVGDRFGDGSILCAVHDLCCGDCREIHVQLRANLVEDLLNGGDLLCAVHQIIGLDRQGFDVLHNINANLVLDHFANALHAGNVCCSVQHIIQGHVCQVVAQLIANLINGYLYVADVEQCIVQLGGLYRIQQCNDLLKGQALHHSHCIVTAEGGNGNQLFLESGGKLIGIQHSCIQLGKNRRSGYVQGQNATGNIKFINVGFEKRIKLCSCILQTAQVTLYYKFEGHVFGLLLIDGSVHGVNHFHVHRYQLAVLDGCKLIQRRNQRSKCFYKICGVKGKRFGIVFLSHHKSVYGKLIHVSHYLIKYGSENGEDVLLYVNALKDLKQLLVVELCKHVPLTNHVDQIGYAYHVNQNVKVNYVLERSILVCIHSRDHVGNLHLFKEALQIHTVDQRAVAANLSCQMANRSAVDNDIILGIRTNHCRYTAHTNRKGHEGGRLDHAVNCHCRSVNERGGKQRFQCVCLGSTACHCHGNNLFYAPRAKRFIVVQSLYGCLGHESGSHNQIHILLVRILLERCHIYRFQQSNQVLAGFVIVPECGIRAIEAVQRSGRNQRGGYHAGFHHQLVIVCPVEAILQIVQGHIHHHVLNFLRRQQTLGTEERILVHVGCNRSGVDVVSFYQSCHVQNLIQILGSQLCHQCAKLFGVSCLGKNGQIHVATQRVYADRLHDLIHVENLKPRSARDDLKQLGDGKRFLERVHVHRYACHQILEQCGRDPVLLQDVGNRACIQGELHLGGGAVGRGIHIKPCIRKNTHGQCRHQSENGEDNGKNFVEHLHNKTSLLCFRFRIFQRSRFVCCFRDGLCLLRKEHPKSATRHNDTYIY